MTDFNFSSAPNARGGVGDLLRKHHWLAKLFALSCLYCIWIAFVRLLTLTLITYFSLSPETKFQEISDIFGSNETSLMGISALLFVMLLHWINPISQSRLSAIFNRENVEKNFLPGFAQGCIFSGGVVLAFILTTHYLYLGFFIRLGDAPLELISIFLRMLTLASLAFCEEYLFRNRILKYAQNFLSWEVTVFLTACIYCGVKVVQFDFGFELGLSQLFTLFLVSICLSYRARKDSSFAHGAGFWAGNLILLHTVLSLPVFGNDFSGILWVKAEASPIAGSFKNNSQSLTHLLTGGSAGPLSSVIFQLLLILDIGRSILKGRKGTSIWQPHK